MLSAANHRELIGILLLYFSQSVMVCLQLYSIYMVQYNYALRNIHITNRATL